jgi:serine/threonine protein phosphatase PrpC
MTDDPTLVASELIGSVRVTVATRRNGRDRNEDAVGIAGWVLRGDCPAPLQLDMPLDRAEPLVVALVDGMGGHPAGDVAAGIAADRLSRPGTSTPADLVAAFERASWEIHAAATESTRGMGATAAAVLLHSDGMVTIAGVGDVRAFRVVDGYLGQLTVDDRGGSAGSVTSWLGGYQRTVVSPRPASQRVRPPERLFLCTDGVHDAIGPDAMLSCLAADSRPAAAGLVAAGPERGDNATAVVIDALPPAAPDLSI